MTQCVFFLWTHDRRAMKQPFHIEPDWRWGTPEGGREFDRLLDRSPTFREKPEWLEEAEPSRRNCAPAVRRTERGNSPAR